MGVYRTLLKKDAFITTQYPAANTGIDEILSLGSTTLADGTRVIQRVLVEPDIESIKSFIQENSISNYKAVLKLKSASASSVSEDTVVHAFPIKTFNNEKWRNGVGKLIDVPKSTSGVSWSNITGVSSSVWAIESGSGVYEFPSAATGSIFSVKGGGSWLTGSLYSTSQSISFDFPIDLSLDITSYVSASVTFISGSTSGSLFDYNGLILKLDSELESGSRKYELNYFSKETNTVFYPQVHLLWDNQQYATGSLLALTSPNIVITSTNLETVYRPLGNILINLQVRPKYPARRFTTSSVYLDKYYLPQTALWSLEDYYTGEVIIPFESPYTRVNCNSTNPYISLDLRLLGLERYYKVVIKAEIQGTEVIRELEPFKISLHGTNY
jgi:hypothetical protein